ncbi:MAG: hypothetical protein V2B20_12715 [Pseudomonadota bacterium]
MSVRFLFRQFLDIISIVRYVKDHNICLNCSTDKEGKESCNHPRIGKYANQERNDGKKLKPLICSVFSEKGTDPKLLQYFQAKRTQVLMIIAIVVSLMSGVFMQWYFRINNDTKYNTELADIKIKIACIQNNLKQNNDDIETKTRMVSEELRKQDAEIKKDADRFETKVNEINLLTKSLSNDIAFLRGHHNKKKTN